MFGIGAGELVMILVAGLIIFGPGELPKVGRAVGKAMREFKKAQAAFTATLDEVSAEPEKKSSPTSEKVSTEKNPVEVDKKISAEKNSVTEKVSVEKNSETEDKNISADETPKQSSLTVDDVINLAKNSPINKENLNEKNFVDNAGNFAPADSNAGNVNSRGNTNGTGK